jgi:transcription antitermination factor NusG
MHDAGNMQDAGSGLANSLWYALHVRRQYEKAVGRNLEAKGLEQFVPLYRSRRRWSDRVKEVEFPLFPGYVFCRFDLKDRIPILTVPGITSIVGVGLTPRPVEESEINALRTVVRAGLPCTPWPFLKAGERVELVRGPLRGLEGIVLDVKSSYRLILSIDLLMRSVAVEVDWEWIRPIRRTDKTLRKTVSAQMTREYPG